MAEHIEYGEAPVSTTVVSQNSATLDELVAIGTSIYQEVIDYSKE